MKKKKSVTAMPIVDSIVRGETHTVPLDINFDPASPGMCGMHERRLKGISSEGKVTR